MAKIEVKQDKGKPCLFIDGKLTPPILYGLSDIPGSNSNTAQAHRNIKNFAEKGINLVNIDTGIHLGWFKAEEYDPSAVIAEIGEVLVANPHAKVLIRLHLNPPYWWLRDNPDECIIYRTKAGDVFGTDNGESDRLIRNDFEKQMRVSLASEKWINEASAILKKLCEFLKDTPEGDAILGFQVACGIFGEWHQWGIDVSHPMQERFKKFVKEKYATEEELKKAYNDENVNFENLRFSPEVFLDGDCGNFRDPRFSKLIIDSQKCIQTSCTDAILTFCKVIKDVLPNVLTGCFYGYLLGVGGNLMTIEGHLEVDTLFQNKKLIDFLCGPFCYLDNRLPDGVPIQRGLLESCRINGVLWLTEMDQFPTCVEELGGDIALKQETISILRRNVLQPLLAGQGLWYYDHRVQPRFVKDKPHLAYLSSIYRKLGWWEKDYLLKEIEDLQKIAKKITASQYTPQADVLLVYDTESYYCCAKVNDEVYPIHKAVASMGVAYDCIYLKDIDKTDIKRYKCVIMVNCYMIDAHKRAVLKNLLESKTTVWLYAAGFCNGETLDIKNISETVGINLKLTQNTTADGIKANQTAYSPFLAVDDKNASPILKYNNGEIAAAKKENNYWVAFQSLPKEVIEAAIMQSGAHRYLLTGDTVMAGGDFIAINCTHGGTFDLFLKNGKIVNITLEKYTTAVFDANTGERLL